MDELGAACVYCGQSAENAVLQPDHLWPEKDGGCTVAGNIVPACPTCNSDRRDMPWHEYMKTSNRVKGTAHEVDQRISLIEQYMLKHNQAEPPTLDRLLTPLELQLLRDFDLLLNALSDGALAKAGHVKKSAIHFDRPDELFDELLATVRAFQRKPS